MTLKNAAFLGLCMCPSVALAQDQRQLGAHEHGVSTIQISVEQDAVTIALRAPGMDIVGFEYMAESNADRAAVENAIVQLSRPEGIVSFPETAGCQVTEATAELDAGDGDHEEGHDHGDDHAHDHDHDEEHAKDDAHDHGDHAAEGAQHSEFHANYAFTCANPDMLTQIAFPFFDTFANAATIDAQFVTGLGAGSATISRDAASLTLD